MGTVALVKEGTMTFVALPDDTADQLAFMHDKLGCQTLEAVMIAPDLIVWVDEEGTFKESNHVSLVAYAEQNQVKYYNELHGNMIITSVDQTGATAPLDANQLERVGHGFRVISTDFPS